MINAAVILGGCGRMDGSEVHESVCTLLSLDKRGVEIHMFAPDIPQTETINHLNNEKSKDTRNVLVEAARIARGNVKDIKVANIQDYDAVFVPGGNGIAKNLFSYAIDGPDFHVHPDVERFLVEGLRAQKPMGFICIAPVLLAKVAGKIGLKVRVTIGNDENVSKTIASLNGIHENCPVSGIVVDEQHQLVTTPAYMLAKRISEVAEGIDHLVEKTLSFVKK